MSTKSARPSNTAPSVASAQIEGGIDLDAYAAGLKVDLKKCRAELAKIRQRGFAVSRDELIEGAVAIAAPIFDGSSRVAGSLGIFGPTVRWPEARVEAFGKLLVDEAVSVSSALGRPPPAGT